MPSWRYFLGAPALNFKSDYTPEVTMNYLKSVLAALFVGEVAYFAAVLALLLKTVGIGSGKATGVSVLFAIARSPMTIGAGVLFFVLALLLFLRN